MAVVERVSVLRNLFILGVSLFWSTFIGLTMLWQILIKGPKKYFHKARREIRPAELDDEQYGEHNFARLKRIRLHYVSKGNPDKPLMLFVHGFPEFWFSWRHQIKEFSKDYRTVAFDMRGYNESEKPIGIKNYTLDKLVNDIKDLITFLGYEKCVLVGHDWGGAITWAFAQMYPEMLERVIVCNCPCYQALKTHMESSFKQFMSSWYIFWFQMPWMPESMMQSNDIAALDGISKTIRGITDDEVELYKYAFSAGDAFTGPINYYRALLQYKDPLHFPTDKITVPSLMIWGKKDKALNVKLAELTKDYVEDYRVQYIEDGTHWVQQDKPEEVNRLMRQFLNQDKTKET